MCNPASKEGRYESGRFSQAVSTSYLGGRFFLKEFLIAIFPFRKVKMSQPTTSTRLPSDWVPENIH